MSTKKSETKRGENRKGGSHKRGAMRHSSPVLDSEGTEEKKAESKSSQLRSEQDRNAKLNANRSSNTSDVSMPGQNLHTDSGISSSDSLAGYDKRLSADDCEAMSDLVQLDKDLAKLGIQGNLSSNITEDFFKDTTKALFTPDKFPAVENIILPMRETDLSVEDNPDASVNSIFMTAVGSKVHTPDSDHALQWSEDSAASPSETRNYNDRDFNAIDSKLYCFLCGELYTNPRLLPCLHTFCSDCLQSRIQTADVSSSSLNTSASSSSSYRSDTLCAGKQSLTCPICSAEVKLSLGVHSLAVNHFVQRLIMLQNMKIGLAENLSCDLCPDNSQIAGRCVQCSANLCLFCSEAHKRQRHTSSHTVLPPESDGTQHGRTKPRAVPMLCQRHSGEELKLYCADCMELVCRDCCLSSKHKDHKCEFLTSVINHKVSEIRSEFQVCEPKIAKLRQSIAMSLHSESTIRETADEVAGKVERHITSYIAALEKHRDVLLASVKKRTENKLEAVRNQQRELEKTLKDISHSCDFTSQLLAFGTHSEIISLQPSVKERLQCLSELQCSTVPRPVHNFIEFRANKPVKTWVEGDVIGNLAGNKRSSRLLRPGLEVDICGDVVSHVVEPKYCTAHGEGIHSSCVRHPSELLVITKNFAREKLENGGESVIATLDADSVSLTSTKKPKVQVVDKKDGTYRVLYIVHAAGSYRLSVQVSGEHIHGSPFSVTAIDSKTQMHSGVFHCCCYCSSSGDKNSTCACGALMPGGYRGCGHGHDGHPGAAHWSCCGNTIEASSCSRVQSRIIEQPQPVLLCGTPIPLLRSQIQRAYSTLPTRGNYAKTYARQRSADDYLYASTSTLRNQTVKQIDPQACLQRQTRPKSACTSKDEIRTVTL